MRCSTCAVVSSRANTLNFFYLHHLHICFPTWRHGDSSLLTFSRLLFLLFLADRSESLSQLHRQKMFYPCRRCRAVTPEASLCLSIPCPSETQLDYHNGLSKLHMEQCFSETSRGCVIAPLALFISLDKACLMPLNVLVGIKKGGPNGNLLTPVLWCYHLAHIVAPWEQD